MEIHNKAGWVVAILVFALGMGWFLSTGSLDYDQVEITPAIDAVYELVPLTPAQILGTLLSALGFSTFAALLIGAVARLLILDTK